VISRYGTLAEHDRALGLDTAGIRAQIAAFRAERFANANARPAQRSPASPITAS
jgi:hypothetical protein